MSRRHPRFSTTGVSQTLYTCTVSFAGNALLVNNFESVLTKYTNATTKPAKCVDGTGRDRGSERHIVSNAGARLLSNGSLP